MSTYDKDTYNVQQPAEKQSQGSGSKLVPIKNTDLIPFSKGRYFYYSINWSIIITLIAVGLLLLDIFYKLLVAFLDILATLFIGWAGMVATAESGKGNAIFIETIMNYGKISLVSGASLGLYIIVTDSIKGMITTLTTNGTLNGVEALIASPIILVVVTTAFLNGSGAFIKFVGADAGFGTASNIFGLMMGRKGLGAAAGAVGVASGAAMRKGINALSSNKSEKSSEKAADHDFKRNYNKAEDIISNANQELAALGNDSTLSHDDYKQGVSQIEKQRNKDLDNLGNTSAGSNFAKNMLKVKPNAQRQAQQRLGMLTQKVESGIASDEEVRELDMMNRSRTGYSNPNLLQKVSGTTASDLAANPANQVDKNGVRKGAINLSQFNANQQRQQWHTELASRKPLNSDTPTSAYESNNEDFKAENPFKDNGKPTEETVHEKSNGTHKVNMKVTDKDTIVEPSVEKGKTTVGTVEDIRGTGKVSLPEVKAPDIKNNDTTLPGTHHHKQTIHGQDIKVETTLEKGKVEYSNNIDPQNQTDDYHKTLQAPPINTDNEQFSSFKNHNED